MNPEKFLGKQIREYTFLEIIGHGGMATVLKAEHVNLKTIRAVKVIRETLSKNPEFEKRFFREARLLVQMTHPGLVQIHEFFEEENHLFLVMNYVPGESLADRIARVGVMHPTEILPIIIQTMEALANAHHLGILHRDISPDNIMLTPSQTGNDQVVIIDFGLAELYPDGDFSAELEAVMTMLLSREPEYRFQTVEEAAVALGNILEAYRNSAVTEPEEIKPHTVPEIPPATPNISKQITLVESVTWFDAVIYCNRRSIAGNLTPCYYSDRHHKTVFDDTPPVI